jgi:hypothetical protein
MKAAEKKRSSRWTWAFPFLFLALGVVSLHSGLTGRGHYSHKYRHYFSAKEDMALSIVSLIGAAYSVVLLVRKPMPK